MDFNTLNTINGEILITQIIALLIIVLIVFILLKLFFKKLKNM